MVELEHDTIRSAEKYETKKPRRQSVVVFSILIVTFCFIAGVVGAAIVLESRKTSDSGTITYAKNDGNAVVTESEQTIASVVESVSPSVVSIVTTSSSSRSFAQQQAAGTGMIVSRDGYVLTNNHVVADADTVTIIRSDGTVHENVRVLGRDPLNDVAFLKIRNVSDLPAVTIGDSKTVRAGQTVIAIGNALGQYQNTVTSGIISGLGRPVVASTDGTSENAESLSDLLQTDAAINSGNSGGPLLNSQGQVIGINTAVAQDANSIGFAIPIGATKGMLEHLIATGRVERAFVGLQFIPITPEVRQEYNLDTKAGNLVRASSGSAVQSGSPGDRAGVKDNDIITKVNDLEVGPGKSISTLIGEYKPGDTVQLTIIRDGQTIQRNIELTTFTS